MGDPGLENDTEQSKDRASRLRSEVSEISTLAPPERQMTSSDI